MLLVFRLGVRITSYRRLYADDVLVIAAWIFFLASNILWHTQLPTVYARADVQNGLVIPSLDFIDKLQALLKAVAAFNFLFICCLWAVKLSFLFFFKRLGERSTQRSIKSSGGLSPLLLLRLGLSRSATFNMIVC